MEDLFIFGSESSSERNSIDNSSTLVTCANVKEYVDSVELNVPYAVIEILVAFFAVLGNGLVISVFYRERRLRRRTNFYIVSLAVADLMFGLFGIPIAILVNKLTADKRDRAHVKNNLFRFQSVSPKTATLVCL